MITTQCQTVGARTEDSISSLGAGVQLTANIGARQDQPGTSQRGRPREKDGCRLLQLGLL